MREHFRLIMYLLSRKLSRYHHHVPHRSGQTSCGVTLFKSVVWVSLRGGSVCTSVRTSRQLSAPRIASSTIFELVE